jgi:hypothetical protein
MNIGSLRKRPPSARRAMAAAVMWCAALASASGASLEFPLRHLAATAKAGEKTIDFSFAFTNRGREAVTIREIHSGCSCTVVEPAKKTFAPGESGTIPVTYTIGSAFGRQQKTIRLFTTDQDEPVIGLVIEIDLPEGPVIEPKFLRWDQHAVAGPRSIQVRIPAGSPWKIIAVHETRGHFTVEWKAAEGGRYEIVVTPLQTDRPATGVITMQTDSETVFHAFAQVRPGGGQPPARQP